MHADSQLGLFYRSLLTDTLPYEVPIIFSNNAFFSSLTEQISDVGLAAAMKKVRPEIATFTKPYTYQVSKAGERLTTLDVVHPLSQINFARFYDRYRASLVYCCSRSPYSIRYPSSVSSDWRAAVTRLARSPRNSDVDSEQNAASGVAPIIKSYFSYSGYSLLGRFYDSREFLRLEKRFSFLRNLDVLRCFSSVYTHSFSWAVKGKEIAKLSSNSHSFENRFDELMRHANYNETNGIVIGPEISRIFAEVILQEVDVRIARDLSELGWVQGWDYEIRRYVDDFFVFANSHETLAVIEETLSRHLSFFKMETNERKVVNVTRPFVSPITLARRDNRLEFRKVSTLLRHVPTSGVASDAKRGLRELREDIESIRLSVARHRADFSALSGWLLGSIRKSIVRLAEAVDVWKQAGLEDDFVALGRSLLDMSFYITFSDTRVQTVYSLSHIIVAAISLGELVAPHNADEIRHVISEELTGLVRRRASIQRVSRRAPCRDDIELYNVLILGAYAIGLDFLRKSVVRTALEGIVAGPHLTYFGYVSAKFCMLKAEAYYHEELRNLNVRVNAMVQVGESELKRDAESYLMFCDYISAPDVDEGSKRAVFNSTFGGTVSRDVMRELAPRLRFVDWKGLAISHLLERKTLRPAYE